MLYTKGWEEETFLSKALSHLRCDRLFSPFSIKVGKPLLQVRRISHLNKYDMATNSLILNMTNLWKVVKSTLSCH
jgi:hypothetical protein